MSDLCAHGQSLLIWVFFEDPQGKLTRNVYDDEVPIDLGLLEDPQGELTRNVYDDDDDDEPAKAIPVK